MEIRTPLHYRKASLSEVNRERWDQFKFGEKLFYKYVLEHDSTLSSMLLGIFSAYVVNLISNLMTLEIEDLLIVPAYVMNLIFAVWTLYCLIKLYRIHLALEKQSEENPISMRLNNDFAALYENRQNDIIRNMKSLERALFGLLVTLLLCFAINNGLLDGMHMIKERFREIWEEWFSGKHETILSDIRRWDRAVRDQQF